MRVQDLESTHRAKSRQRKRLILMTGGEPEGATSARDLSGRGKSELRRLRHKSQLHDATYVSKRDKELAASRFRKKSLLREKSVQHLRPKWSIRPNEPNHDKTASKLTRSRSQDKHFVSLSKAQQVSGPLISTQRSTSRLKPYASTHLMVPGSQQATRRPSLVHHHSHAALHSHQLSKEKLRQASTEKS